MYTIDTINNKHPIGYKFFVKKRIRNLVEGITQIKERLAIIRALAMKVGKRFMICQEQVFDCMTLKMS